MKCHIPPGTFRWRRVKKASVTRVQATSSPGTARAALETIRFERGDRRHVWGMIDDYFRPGRCCGCR